MIAVIARLTAKEGQEGALESALRELGAEVLKNEPDVKLYQLCKGRVPRQLTMVERYATKEALDAHGKTPYIAAAFKKMGPLLDGAPDIEILKEL